MCSIRFRWKSGCRSSGFTLIELLTVIGIMMLVMALALPNFSAMMKGQKWTSTISRMQTMIWQARALATNARKDIGLEFDVQDNGTSMWLESEMPVLERLPDLFNYQLQVDSAVSRGNARWIMYTYWVPSGGDFDSNGAFPNPGYYYNLTLDPALSSAELYGDNAQQSELVHFAYGMTVDLGTSVTSATCSSPGSPTSSRPGPMSSTWTWRLSSATRPFIQGGSCPSGPTRPTGCMPEGS
jgi:type II secretory pathway pseudopilin PulG